MKKAVRHYFNSRKKRKGESNLFEKRKRRKKRDYAICYVIDWGGRYARVISQKKHLSCTSIKVSSVLAIRGSKGPFRSRPSDKDGVKKDS